MLQRNITGSPQILPTIVPPAEVPPGGEIDYPDPLPGFEVVAPAEEAKPAAKAKTTPKAAAPSDAEEATK